MTDDHPRRSFRPGTFVVTGRPVSPVACYTTVTDPVDSSEHDDPTLLTKTGDTLRDLFLLLSSQARHASWTVRRHERLTEDTTPCPEPSSGEP